MTLESESRSSDRNERDDKYPEPLDVSDLSIEFLSEIEKFSRDKQSTSRGRVNSDGTIEIDSSDLPSEFKSLNER